MNNLHRELAPYFRCCVGADRRGNIAYAQAPPGRTARRGPAWTRGQSFSAVGTGHLTSISAPSDGVIARQREVKALVELRVPFEL